MTSNTSNRKRKNSLTGKKERKSSTSKEEELNTAVNDEDEDDLLNSIEDDDADSSDSEAEVEESDGEIEEFPDFEDAQNESDDKNISEEDENSGQDEDEEESDEEAESDEDLDESEGDNEIESDEDNKDSEIDSDEDNKIEKSKRNEAEIERTKTKSKTSKKLQETDKSKSISKITEKTKLSKPTPPKTPDEYEHDTSDEEDIRNTIGNVPRNWYDEYPHIGYSQTGERILKPPSGDQLDEFLRKVEDPDFWRTVKDPQTGQEVILGQEEIDLIKRIQGQRIPDQEFDDYAPWIEWFTSEVMQTPIRKFPEHKRSFVPSKHEAKKVSRLVHALNMGWIKTRAEAAAERAKTKEPQFYMLWQSDDTAEDMRRIHKHIPAPKRHLPGHAESYNPPPEYLLDAKEMKEWEKLKDTPWKRKLHFLPKKYGSLREVPSYSKYIRERFLRCLDLYLCPRAIKMRLNIEPESLVPQLPSPRDLQPFPTTLSVEYLGHSDMIRSISCDPKGQYLASGSDDQTVKIWEINTGRCLKTFDLEDVVRCVSWCPNPALSLVAVASGNHVYLINPGVGDHLVVSKTDTILQEPLEQDIIVPDRVKTTVQWHQIAPTSPQWLKQNIRLHLEHFKLVTQVTWHAKGDYFAVVLSEAQSRSVVVSQVSRRRSQLPFAKSKGLVQCVLFHPVRPYLFVATQRNIRIYDLAKQDLVKKLLSNSKWISSMAVHPGGDNLLVGTYDRKMLWFDLDLSTKPYQTLRLHGTAVRAVAYHKRYPLFASGADDRSLIVSHGMVYNDLLQNPLIVPLKRLQDHESFNDFGIFDVIFHPSQPWVFSSGADGTIKLYS